MMSDESGMFSDEADMFRKSPRISPAQWPNRCQADWAWEVFVTLDEKRFFKGIGQCELDHEVHLDSLTEGVKRPEPWVIRRLRRNSFDHG